MDKAIAEVVFILEPIDRHWPTGSLSNQFPNAHWEKGTPEKF